MSAEHRADVLVDEADLLKRMCQALERGSGPEDRLEYLGTFLFNHANRDAQAIGAEPLEVATILLERT